MLARSLLETYSRGEGNDDKYENINIHLKFMMKFAELFVPNRASCFSTNSTVSLQGKHRSDDEEINCIDRIFNK